MYIYFFEIGRFEKFRIPPVIHFYSCYELLHIFFLCIITIDTIIPPPSNGIVYSLRGWGNKIPRFGCPIRSQFNVLQMALTHTFCLSVCVCDLTFMFFLCNDSYPLLTFPPLFSLSQYSKCSIHGNICICLNMYTY